MKRNRPSRIRAQLAAMPDDKLPTIIGFNAPNATFADNLRLLRAWEDASDHRRALPRTQEPLPRHRILKELTECVFEHTQLRGFVAACNLPVELMRIVFGYSSPCVIDHGRSCGFEAELQAEIQDASIQPGDKSILAHCVPILRDPRCPGMLRGHVDELPLGGLSLARYQRTRILEGLSTHFPLLHYAARFDSQFLLGLRLRNLETAEYAVLRICPDKIRMDWELRALARVRTRRDGVTTNEVLANLHPRDRLSVVDLAYKVGDYDSAETILSEMPDRGLRFQTRKPFVHPLALLCASKHEIECELFAAMGISGASGVRKRIRTLALERMQRCRFADIKPAESSGDDSVEGNAS